MADELQPPQEEKKGFWGHTKTIVGAPFKAVGKTVDVVTTPVRALDDAVQKRTDKLYDDGNTGWAKASETLGVVTGSITKAGESVVGSGGSPQAAAVGGAFGAANEIADFGNSNAEVMNRWKGSQGGSKEKTEADIERFRDQLNSQPTRTDIAAHGKGFVDGFLGRKKGNDSDTLKAYDRFKSAGGDVAELEKSGKTIDEYLKSKSVPKAKEVAGAGNTEPEKEKKGGWFSGWGKGKDKEAEPEKEPKAEKAKFKGGRPHADASEVDPDKPQVAEKEKPINEEALAKASKIGGSLAANGASIKTDASREGFPEEGEKVHVNGKGTPSQGAELA